MKWIFTHLVSISEKKNITFHQIPEPSNYYLLVDIWYVGTTFSLILFEAFFSQINLWEERREYMNYPLTFFFFFVKSVENNLLVLCKMFWVRLRRKVVFTLSGSGCKDQIVNTSFGIIFKYSVVRISGFVKMEDQHMY